MTFDASAGDHATISGHGFEPNETVTVAQCAAQATPGDDMIDVCDLREHVNANADATGAIKVDVPLFPVIAHGLTRHEVVCPQDGCTIGLSGGGESGSGTSGSGDTLAVTTDELTWPADTVIPESPVLSIESLKLNDTDDPGTARIHGAGFVPNAKVSLTQCPGDEAAHSIDSEDCIYDYGTTLNADEDGTFTVDIAVQPKFQRANNELISCIQTPEQCLITNPWPDDPGSRFALVSLAKAPVTP